MDCVLCGSMVDKPTEMQATARICKLVSARYKEGPFAWPSLFGHRGEGVACCSQCLNHIRKRRGIRQKEMLPMDHFLISLLNPGCMPAVDQRSARRLWMTLRHEGNRFRHTGVWPLESILASDCPIRVWWMHNLSTPFFRDKHAARLVRLELDK